MKFSESDQSELLQQLVNTEGEDRTIQLFSGKAYNSLVQENLEEIIHDLNIYRENVCMNMKM